MLLAVKLRWVDARRKKTVREGGIAFAQILDKCPVEPLQGFLAIQVLEGKSKRKGKGTLIV